jgi:hypothetical protein
MKKNKIYYIGKVLALIAFGLLINSFSDNTGISYCIFPVALPLLMAGGGIVSSLLGRKKSKAAPPPKPINIFEKNAAGVSPLMQSSAGISNYYTNQVPGLTALSRETMQNLSPEQAEAVRRAGLQVNEAGKFRQGFDLNLAGAMSKYGSMVGNYQPTISQKQANQLYDTSMAQTMAQEAFNRRGVLSGEEQRAAQQQARESFAASGRIGGNAAIAAEIQNREAARAARRSEAASAGQIAYDQGLKALQQRLATQQDLFSQNLGIGAQQAQERQLGFNQFMTGEQQRSALLDQSMRANTASAGLAQDFYTTPGLNMFAMPLNFANQAAGATNQYNKDKYAVDAANQQAKAKMFSDIGSALLSAGMSGGMGTSLGNFGSFLGSGNMGNASTAFSNIGFGALGQPLKAYTV